MTSVFLRVCLVLIYLSNRKQMNVFQAARKIDTVNTQILSDFIDEDHNIRFNIIDLPLHLVEKTVCKANRITRLLQF